MAKKICPSKFPPEIERYIEGAGKLLSEKHFGPNGPAWGTKFSQIEQEAVDLGNALARQIMNVALQKQAATGAAAEQANVCPECQQPLLENDPEPRVVVTRAGDAQWIEPKRRCTRCRRDFFPSVQGPGH